MPEWGYQFWRSCNSHPPALDKFYIKGDAPFDPRKGTKVPFTFLMITSEVCTVSCTREEVCWSGRPLLPTHLPIGVITEGTLLRRPGKEPRFGVHRAKMILRKS